MNRHNQTKRILKHIKNIVEEETPKIDTPTRYKLLSGLEWILTHLEIEGTKDGVKVAFKKEI